MTLAGRPRKLPVQRLLRLLEATDPELASHGVRAARLAGDVGLALGLPSEKVHVINAAAQLHDIGKLFIRRQILDKPGPLIPREWEELRRHPEKGFELVMKRVPRAVAEIVLTHHERFDGSGYPNALSGERIPFGARVLQVADAFDAITSVRPYQPALPVDYAISELTRCAGTQFDPDAVNAIVSLSLQPEWITNRALAPLQVSGDVAV
jgi:HD-GYP domain-containing protein (c-di-GMP phosphodiesterase class II)